MEIQQLRCYVAVADELHFGRAAERLNLTASPVSRAIKDLERELETELFVRKYHSVELTDTGRELLAPARRILRELEAIKDLARQRAGIRTLTVGATHLAPHRLIDDFFDLVDSVVADGTSFEFVGATSVELFAGVERNDIDVALVHLPADDSKFDHIEIARYTFVAIMRADDPLAVETSLRLDDLRSRKITIQPESPQPLAIKRFHQNLRAHGITDFDRLEDYDAGRLAVHVRHSRGIGITLNPLSGGNRVFDDPAFAVVPLLDDDIPFSAGVVWRRKADANSAPLRQIVDGVRGRWLDKPDIY